MNTVHPNVEVMATRRHTWDTWSIEYINRRLPLPLPPSASLTYLWGVVSFGNFLLSDIQEASLYKPPVNIYNEQHYTQDGRSSGGGQSGAQG